MSIRHTRSAVLAVSLCLASGLVLVACGRGNDSPSTPAAPAADGGTAATASVAFGAQLFEDNCAGCHGSTGKGDGPAAVAGPTKPRDLTAEPYKYVSIGEGTSEVDALVAYIRVGRIESGMPPYSFLKPEELKSLGLFIESLRPQPNFTDAGKDEDEG
ncbi:MAG: c-type cytochrome [Phycisphaerales bacterium JB041]